MVNTSEHTSIAELSCQTQPHSLMRLQVWLLKSGCIDIVHLSFYKAFDLVRCNTRIED